MRLKIDEVIDKIARAANLKWTNYNIWDNSIQINTRHVCKKIIKNGLSRIDIFVYDGEQ